MKKFIIAAIISSLIIPNAVFANESFSKELMDKAISNLNVNTQELSQEQMVKYHTDLNNEYVRLIKEREAQLEKERKEKEQKLINEKFANLKEGTIEHRKQVLRFQAANNLLVDGSLGPATKEALAENKKPVDKIEKPPTNGKWIAVDFSLRNLTLYEGNKVIKKFPVTVGKNGSQTPTGKTKIVNKTKNRRWNGAGKYKPIAGGSPKNPLGPRWLGLSSNIGTGYGIHGTNDEWSIGKNASLGCIRMLNDDAIELFDMVSEGAPVWLGTTEKLESWGLIKNSR